MEWRFPGWRGAKVLCPNASCGHQGWGVAVASGGTPEVCARCHQPLPRGNGRTPAPRALAVLGTERCGKTSWLVRGLDALCMGSDSYTFPLEGQEEQWRAWRQALDLGRVVPPTPAVPGVAWCLDRVQDGRHQRLYVYDTSGLEAVDPQRLARHRSFQHLDGLVLVVDPFGLPVVQRTYGTAVRTMRPPVEPTTRAFGEVHLAAVLQALDTFRPRPLDGRWTLSVAVVVTKLDVMGLIRTLGDERSATEASVEAACRRQLQAWGFENMLRQLDFHFRRVRYFASTPRGNGPFSPGHPLLWSLDVAV